MADAKIINPFNPFGPIPPQNLAGRQKEIGEFRHRLRSTKAGTVGGRGDDDCGLYVFSNSSFSVGYDRFFFILRFIVTLPRSLRTLIVSQIEIPSFG